MTMTFCLQYRGLPVGSTRKSGDNTSLASRATTFSLVYCGNVVRWEVAMASWSIRTAKRWEKEKASLRTTVVKIDTTLVGPVFDPMGHVSDGYIIIKGPVKDAIVMSERLDAFMRHHDADRPSHFAQAICPRNTYLLMDETVKESFEMSLVGALGHFDTEDDQPSNVVCLSLSPWDYGIMLAPTNDGTHRFRRVGAFDVYRTNWMKACELKMVTII
ncbi:hypothetical protein BJ875DRAFT_443279 [Amylocarpus encephaloides]|uniref:Uncharacterized protein n=1 Tax=Amylocarpus encephaloides TaxID=45428 RepID=A0A9P7YFW9_9HELO|nr:hypothetical protein BJ875DRAFT_443279 [Amylocarpus encephaloides]